jgi:hypothetical protein
MKGRKGFTQNFIGLLFLFEGLLSFLRDFLFLFFDNGLCLASLKPVLLKSFKELLLFDGFPFQDGFHIGKLNLQVSN